MQPQFPLKINFSLRPQSFGQGLDEDAEFAFWDEYYYQKEISEEKLFEKICLYQPVKTKKPVN